MTDFPYKIDTNAADVRVEEGGRVTGRYDIGNGLYVVNIALDEPLEAGQETELKYTTEFRYREAPPPEFRQAAGRLSMQQLGITVVFDEEHQPSGVWQAQWDGFAPDSDIVSEVPVQPETYDLLGIEPGVAVRLEQGNVQRGTVIGFHWEWPAATYIG
jgi:hypothetical protein